MKVTIIALSFLFAILTAQDIKHIGSSSCKTCHKKVEKGAQYPKWETTAHAKAFETLKSDQASKIAIDKGIETPAWKTPECLKCHTTGFGKGGYEIQGDTFWFPPVDDKAGLRAVKRMKGLQAVGCESCHGPGSAYKSSKIMKSIYAGETEAITVGLIPINEETCVACHNESSPTFKPFNFEERINEISHPIPEG